MTMLHAYRRFELTEAAIPAKGGGIVQQSCGCDGKKHVVYVEIVFHEDECEESFAAPVLVLKQGSCDGSCGQTDKGVFEIYEEEDVESAS